ncbi:MAG: HDOD domain-containing protein [Pseudomonadota bacterium]
MTLPASVKAAVRLQRVLDNPKCPIDDVIKLVLGEPQLAARTVALANSPAFNCDGDAAISSVSAAVKRVGYRSVQSLLATLVVRQFGCSIVDPALRARAEQLWEHTAHVAALAHVMARHVTCVNPDTALFAAIVHEAGGFYLLSRAEDFPGLLDDDPAQWTDLCEESVSREVLRKLAVPEQVCSAILGLRDGFLSMPPSTLLDTLMLADQYAPVASPLGIPPAPLPAHCDSVLDFVIDEATLQGILDEGAAQFKLMRASLLV